MNSPAADRIHAEIHAHGIVLYMRGTSAFPLCGGSAAIVQILEHLGLRYRAIDVLADPGINAALRGFADWPTLPQLYIAGDFIGDAEIVQQMYETGELQELFSTRGLS